MEATAPAATIHLEGIRIMPTPLSQRQQAPIARYRGDKPFMVQMIRQAVGTACLRFARQGQDAGGARTLDRCDRGSGDRKRYGHAPQNASVVKLDALVQTTCHVAASAESHCSTRMNALLGTAVEAATRKK